MSTGLKSGSHESAVGRLDALVPWAIVFGPLPLVATFFFNLWNDRPHYQFFPLYLATIVWLSWTRSQSSWSVPQRAPRWEVALLMIGFGSFVLAVLAHSPWLGIVSWLLLVAGVLLDKRGGSSARQWLPVWTIAWLMVPPPLQWDVEFLQWLRSQTSNATGVLLDVLGVVHLQSGNTFEVPGFQFFVQDACSGIHSLLALVCVSALWSVHKQLPLFAALCLMASAAWTAVVMNILRVLAIVITYSQWSVDLSTGWRHEVLGIVLFGLSLLFLLSSTQLCLFWFAKAPMNLRDSDCPTDSTPNESPLCASGITTPSAFRQAPRIVIAVCAILLWIPQLGQASRDWTSRQKVTASLSATSSAVAITENDMPQEIHGWTCLDFKTVERDRHNLEGEFSRQWTYRAPFGTVHVSFDFPFEGVHPLLRCYQSTGWNPTVIQTVAVNPAANSGGFQEVQLKRHEFEQGFLLFSLWTDRGELVSLRPSAAAAAPQSLVTRLQHRIFSTTKTEPSNSSTTYQFQMLIVSEFSLSKADREAVRHAFLELRDRFRRKLQDDADPSTKTSASSSQNL